MLPPPPENQPMSFDDKVYSILGVFHVVSKPVELVLRVPSTFGKRYIDANTGIGVVLMFFWIGVGNPFLAVHAFNVSIALMILHRIAIRWRPKHVTTRYNGYPWVSQLTGMSEENAKDVVEPLLLFVAGALSMGFCEALGWYLWAAAGGLVATNCFIKMRDDARLEAIQDAQIEQEVFIAQVGMRADADRSRESFSPGKSGGIMLRVAMLAVVVGVSWFAWSTGWAASHLGLHQPGRQSMAGRYMELSERPRLSPSERAELRRLEAAYGRNVIR